MANFQSITMAPNLSTTFSWISFIIEFVAVFAPSKRYSNSNPFDTEDGFPVRDIYIITSVQNRILTSRLGRLFTPYLPLFTMNFCLHWTVEVGDSYYELSKAPASQQEAIKLKIKDRHERPRVYFSRRRIDVTVLNDESLRLMGKGYLFIHTTCTCKWVNNLLS